MKTFQVLRDLCALIVTTILRWLSKPVRRPTALAALALTAFVAWPVQAVFANVAVVYVNIAGTPTTEDGTSWSNAYRFLQDGLSGAQAILDDPQAPPDLTVEIWVAQGTYYPAAAFGANSRIDMLDNVGIFGGFSGDGTETSRDQRRPLENITTISGSFGGSPVATTIASSGNDDTARLDGFHIIDGKRAIDMSNSSAIISNCTIRENMNTDAVVATGSQPQFINCIFRDNSEQQFVIYVDGSTITLVNCLLHDNEATAILADWASNLTMINCTVANNTSSTGFNGGVYVYFGSEATISNSILWGNSAGVQFNQEEQQVFIEHDSTGDVSHSAIQGLDEWNHSGNIGDNPQFVNSAGGDFRLMAISPCIDTAGGAIPEDVFDINEDGVTITIPGVQEGEATPDLDWNPRITLSGADMGPYELYSCEEFEGTDFSDCNGNLAPDECDILAGRSADCNGNWIPDECEIADGAADCNGLLEECLFCNEISIVFVLDVTESMGNDYISICPSVVAALQGHLVTKYDQAQLHFEVLQLGAGSGECGASNFVNEFGGAPVTVPGDNGDCIEELGTSPAHGEAWATATSIAAAEFGWGDGANIIVTIGG